MTLPVLRLSRTAAIGKVCVLGQIRDIANGEIQAVTLELPWRDDVANKSCIPTGVYTVTPFDSPHLGYKCYRFDAAEVAPRTAIEVHAGNTAEDIEGCVLVGSYYGIYKGKPAVLASRTTLITLLDSYPDGFTFHITEESLA